MHCQLIGDAINASRGGTTNPELGTGSITPASKEMLDVMFPSALSFWSAAVFRRVTQSTAVFGPWPDAAIRWRSRDAAADASILDERTTFISTILPSFSLLRP